jgi:tetratricopeptide (TPR) repeat protein
MLTISARGTAAIAGWLLCGCLIQAAGEPDQEEIAKWIKQLGDRDDAKRGQAFQALWKAGSRAESELKNAAAGDNADVGRQVSDLLDFIKFGITPECPKQVIDLVDELKFGNYRSAVPELVKSGKHGYAVLRKLPTPETDPEQQEEIKQHIGRIILDRLPCLLLNDQTADLEELLGIGVDKAPKELTSAYAAYWMFNEKLPQRIRLLQARLWCIPSSQTAETLIQLHWVNHDYEAARQLAIRYHSPKLQGILVQMKEWKELAKRVSDIDPGELDVDQLAVRAAYQRLAGHEQSADLTLTEIKNRVWNSNSWSKARALLLNDQVEDALRILSDKRSFDTFYELLCDQCRFKEALAVVDEDSAFAEKSPIQAAILRARTLFLMGEKEVASRTFKDVADRLCNGKDTSESFSDLLEAECKVGLKDQAKRHCLKWLMQFDSKTLFHISLLPVFEEIFPRQGGQAAVWWNALRADSEDAKGEEDFKKLTAILTGKIAEKELARLVDVATEQHWKRSSAGIGFVWYSLVVSGMSASSRLLAIEQTCKTMKADELVKKVIKHPHFFQNEEMVRLGDYWAEKKSWTEAAAAYQDAVADDPCNPTRLFLLGNALVESKQGKEDEGKRLMEKAQQMPLGNESGHYELAQELQNRGFTKAAERQLDIVLRLGDFKSKRSAEIWKDRGYDLAEQGRFSEAADFLQWSILSHLINATELDTISETLSVPAFLHYCKARALLAKEEWEKADVEIKRCLAALPGNIDWAIALCQCLDKAGRKHNADKLFEAVWKAFEQVCQDFPKSAWAHNNRAWLGARCRRKLDQALESGLQAVKLEPANAWYLDTLAEVHFQLGQRDKALETIRKAIALDPESKYYKAQLRRIEAGDAAAEIGGR